MIGNPFISGVSPNLCVKYARRGYKHFVYSTCTPTELKFFYTGNNTLKQYHIAGDTSIIQSVFTKHV